MITGLSQNGTQVHPSLGRIFDSQRLVKIGQRRFKFVHASIVASQVVISLNLKKISLFRKLLSALKQLERVLETIVLDIHFSQTIANLHDLLFNSLRLHMLRAMLLLNLAKLALQ